MNEREYENEKETTQEVEAEIFKASPIPETDSSVSFIKLRCENCGGTLQTDANHKILCCPYCQSKTLVVNDSPLQVHTEIEIDKAHTYANMSTAKEKMRLENDRKELIILAVLAAVCVIALVIILAMVNSL